MTSAMRRPGGEATLRFLLWGAIAFIAASWLLRPLNDPDFFWHLKTGEWIWEHRELPSQDPFNYLNQAVEPTTKRFVLTTYWLSQVLYHLVHRLGGFPGIVALKAAVALLFVLTLVKLRRGDPVVCDALLLAALPLLLGLFLFDRPQAFSFLFFALLLLLLERQRSARPPGLTWGWSLPVPLLMLVWANMHGGSAIGQVLILLSLALEGVKFAHPFLRPMGWERYRGLLVTGTAGLAASLLNPNSYHAIEMALLPAQDWIGLFDYLSTVQFFRDMHQPLVVIYWGALVLTALACLVTARQPDITRIVLLVGTGYYGFQHVRFIPFFMVAALPVLGQALSAERTRAWARSVLVPASVVLALFFTSEEFLSRERVRVALSVNENVYPVRAADFVLANNLQGNLYNTYFWGGYLLWRLGPERKVFVDGRGINQQATYESATINMAYAKPGESTPYWKRLLQKHEASYMVIPAILHATDTPYEDTAMLREALQRDPDWVRVHADEIAQVFVRRTPAHLGVIASHGLRGEPPPDSWLGGDYARGNHLARSGRREEAAAAFRQAIRAEPRNYEAWNNLGCVLGELGRLDEAVAAFEEALRLKPDHRGARKNLTLVAVRRRQLK